jgi:hypothetical protein
VGNCSDMRCDTKCDMVEYEQCHWRFSLEAHEWLGRNGGMSAAEAVSLFCNSRCLVESWLCDLTSPSTQVCSEVTEARDQTNVRRMQHTKFFRIQKNRRLFLRNLRSLPINFRIFGAGFVPRWSLKSAGLKKVRGVALLQTSVEGLVNLKLGDNSIHGSGTQGLGF